MVCSLCCILFICCSVYIHFLLQVKCTIFFETEKASLSSNQDCWWFSTASQKPHSVSRNSSLWKSHKDIHRKQFVIKMMPGFSTNRARHQNKIWKFTTRDYLNVQLLWIAIENLHGENENAHGQTYLENWKCWNFFCFCFGLLWICLLQLNENRKQLFDQFQDVSVVKTHRHTRTRTCKAKCGWKCREPRRYFE